METGQLRRPGIPGIARCNQYVSDDAGGRLLTVIDASSLVTGSTVRSADPLFEFARPELVGMRGTGNSEESAHRL
jgi:hypothetical protein